ncbi:MAG TPA: uracil-DNA glycosylase family protein [Opitutaceae bacterium]|nr:uracil-DNA glycosylase family protein [Opitutaceae bacterium]
MATPIEKHIAKLSACRKCPAMHKPVVVGRPVLSRAILVGQAPGDKEPIMGRPFAWTAGKTLFKWFNSVLGWTEDQTRDRLYFAAVCRCFPGKNPTGGDRVPNPEEIANCSAWLDREFELLQPELVIPVGKLAIGQFLPLAPLTDLIGKTFTTTRHGRTIDVIPLPHPSGASPWHRIEPGMTLLRRALKLIAVHPAIAAASANSEVEIKKSACAGERRS